MGNLASSTEFTKGAVNDSDRSKESDKKTDGIKDKSSVTDKPKGKGTPRKKKILEEPEILVLSSDEEGEDKGEDKQPEARPPVSGGLSKEPLYSEKVKMAVDPGIGINTEEIKQNLEEGLYTTVLCRTVRVGSYKTKPLQRVFLSNEGINISLKHVKNPDVNVTLVISLHDVLKALIHFGKEIPVIFLYVYPYCAERIRNLLGMNPDSGPYFDPTGNNEAQKRFTFLPEKLTEDNKTALNNILVAKNLMIELNESEANEILVSARPMEANLTHHHRHCELDPDTKILVFPPPPEKAGITINLQDYNCLGGDRLLNDVIIDFYLKYLLLRVLSPEDRSRTHVFSTFFYKRLTTKPKNIRKNDPESDPKLLPEEKRHRRVKGWTKQVNLFEKDFIIIPINENSHWFLAIICFPGLRRPVRFSDGTPVELTPSSAKSKKDSTPPAAPATTPPKSTQSKTEKTVQIGSTTITHVVKQENSVLLDNDGSSDRDEADGDEADLNASSDDEESEQAEEENASTQIPLLAPTSVTTQPKEKPRPRGRVVKEPIKQPCILIFDSLAGNSRVRVVATLRDYLNVEYKTKINDERPFNKDTMKGAVPKVPQQTNFTDCGLYVLQYVEAFFKTPIVDYNLPMRQLKEWFTENVVSQKRQEIALLIKTLIGDTSSIKLTELSFGPDMQHDEDHEHEEDEDDEEFDEEEECDEEEDEECEEEENENVTCDRRNMDDLSDMDIGDDDDDELMGADDEREEGEEEHPCNAMLDRSDSWSESDMDLGSQEAGETVPVLEDLENQIVCSTINKQMTSSEQELVNDKKIVIARSLEDDEVKERGCAKRTITTNLKSVRIPRRSEAKRPKVDDEG